MKFIGIDLGWKSGASGLCCLELKENKLQILDLDIKLEISEVLAWCDRAITPAESGIIAVDAPTIIPNQTGMRLPDKLTHRHFGRYHAGCYPANLNRPFADRTVGFGNSLTERKFQHAPKIEAKKLGRYQIEVFPHPATINLFKLERILKYKKGKIAEKKSELEKLKNYICSVLPSLEPALKIDSIPAIPSKITGKELKNIEDKLDSVICAYVAAYWWYWGERKNLVLGDEIAGYIVIPRPEASENMAQ